MGMALLLDLRKMPETVNRRDARRYSEKTGKYEQ
jgi:hypothetical protein